MILPIPEGMPRSYDNLYLSYFAFNVFLQYGRYLKVAKKFSENNPIREALKVSRLKKKYAAVLKKISNRQDMLNPELQATCLLLALLKNLPLYRAEVVDYNVAYKIPNGPCKQRCPDTYGHHAILDLTQQHIGVFIENTKYLKNYPEQYVSRTLLVVHHDAFVQYYSKQSELCRDIRQPLPYSSFRDFEATLHKQNILLGKSRYDSKHPDYVNYTITGYPCCVFINEIGRQCRTTSVLVFNLKNELIEKVCLCVITIMTPLISTPLTIMM